MKMLAAKEKIMNACKTLYEQNELKAISQRIIEHLSGKQAFALHIDKNIEIDEEALQHIIDELNHNKPIQYILGYEWFANLKLKVNEGVLIPRPETEELTRKVISYIKQHKINNCQILDIGTGSGCIPILIKKELPNASLFAIDISNDALIVAKENATVHQTPILFLEVDIRNETSLEMPPLDVIISNPPYILQEEKKDMHIRVFSNEPEVALFVTHNDPLEFYKAILKLAKKLLKHEGILFLEINSLYSMAIQSLYENDGFVCTIEKDMYDNERFAIVTFKH